MALYCLPATVLQAQQPYSLSVSEDIDVEIVRYAADGDYLLLWLAPEYGFREPHRQLASRLPAEGIEVWQLDIVEALFLPQGSGSLRALDGSHIAELIELAHRQSGKKIAVVGDSYASLAALSGAREWQRRQNQQSYLVGAVLFTPNTYESIPPLGQQPEYMPIVDATNIPVVVFQAQKYTTMRRFEELVDRLGSNGNPVYTRILPGVMSLFYQHPPTAEMHDSAAAIPAVMRKMLPLLARHELPRQPAPMRENAAAKSGIDIYLREFSAEVRPSGLDMEDVDGRRVVKTDFTGKVTLINFWATWCPPCVEEIPSLNRLQQKMDGRPFELISVNFAERRDAVAAFMQQVAVDFPVLLDLDGRHAEAWNITTYPSTFVIDPRGRIRYGVNAAIDWDDPQLIDKLEALMN